MDFTLFHSNKPHYLKQVSLKLSFFLFLISVLSVDANAAQKVDPPLNNGDQVSSFYAIQIMASKKTVDPRSYTELTEFGDVYLKEEGRYYKIRLGVYVSKESARGVLNILKQASNAYRGAFITTETQFTINELQINIFGTPEDQQLMEYGRTNTNTFTQRAVSTAPPRVVSNYYNPTQRIGQTYNNSNRLQRFTSGIQPLNGYNNTGFESPYIVDAKEYSVQISASESYLDIEKYKSLKKYGTVYISDENGMYKVRVGFYGSQSEAKKYRDRIRKYSKKYKSAFVAEERGQIVESI